MQKEMFEFGSTFDLKRIKSEDACLYLAKMLRTLADDLDYRREEIADRRKNAEPIDDRYPILGAASRALEVYKSGGDGVAECRKLSAELWVPFIHVHKLYQHKVRAYESELRNIRDGMIRKWDYQGLSHAEIASRCARSGFPISRSRVCKIINGNA